MPFRRSRWLLALALAAAAPLVARADEYPPPMRATIPDKSGVVTVPFRRSGGHLYLDALIQGKPAVFVLDCGAGADILTPQAAARLGIPASGTANVRGTAGSSAARLALIKRLEVGGAILENDLVYIVPLPEALQCDGLLGFHFFSRFVLTIDWQANQITLRSPDKFTPPSGIAPLSLQLNENTPSVSVTAGGIKGRFGLDTGYSGAITLNTPFVEKKRLRDKYPKRLETITGRGIGGLLKGDIVRLGVFQIGAHSMRGPLADLSRQKEGTEADSATDGNIGSEILSRFTVTFDYSRKRLFLEPNRAFADPFRYNRSGLAVDYDRAVYTVVAVVPGTPGAEAGVIAGDQVLALNGKPVQAVLSSGIRDTLRGEPGTSVRLLVRSGEGAKPREVILTLRELL
ncbi:MAG: aspartyl protease family protein [Cytophagales bacterium]|nr:aspartyl protease family protein [Armatimonadota bacterium]